MKLLRIAVALVVLAIWATGWILSYANPAQIDPPNTLTPIALIVVGFLLGTEVIRALRGGNRDDGD